MYTVLWRSFSAPVVVLFCVYFIPPLNELIFFRFFSFCCCVEFSSHHGGHYKGSWVVHWYSLIPRSCNWIVALNCSQMILPSWKWWPFPCSSGSVTFPSSLTLPCLKLRQMASPLFHFHLFFPDSHSTGPLEIAKSFSSSQNIVCLQSGRLFCFSPHLLPSVPTQAQHCLVPFIRQSCGLFFLTIFPHFSLTLSTDGLYQLSGSNGWTQRKGYILLGYTRLHSTVWKNSWRLHSLHQVWLKCVRFSLLAIPISVDNCFLPPRFEKILCHLCVAHLPHFNCYSDITHMASPSCFHICKYYCQYFHTNQLGHLYTYVYSRTCVSIWKWLACWDLLTHLGQWLLWSKDLPLSPAQLWRIPHLCWLCFLLEAVYPDLVHIPSVVLLQMNTQPPQGISVMIVRLWTCYDKLLCTNRQQGPIMGRKC